MLRSLADNQQSDSLANRFRKKRFAFFDSLLEKIEHPIKLLDVGGTADFWQNMGFNVGEKKVDITLLNVTAAENTPDGFTYLVGDAREMSQFSDCEFDIVFSNSVIEHVGDFEDQQKMANEVQRVGKRYFVQTPNYYFPLEPHFLFPGFQFLPLATRAWLLMHFNLGWTKRVDDRETAIGIAESVQLLTRKQLRTLFPKASFYAENIGPLTKSYTAYSGWE